jgi:hypothetical protein
LRKCWQNHIVGRTLADTLCYGISIDDRVGQAELADQGV